MGGGGGGYSVHCTTRETEQRHHSFHAVFSSVHTEFAWTCFVARAEGM